MQIFANTEFLRWAAEAGLVPDPRYPQSRQQLVFASGPDYCKTWRAPDASDARAEFVRTLLGLGGDAPWRIRLRGGGAFGAVKTQLQQERALGCALSSAVVPTGAAGLEFAQEESGVLHELALAFLVSGYRVETDFEIVASDRHSCLMLCHDRELVAHFSSRERLSSFTQAMAAAGYLDDARDEEESSRRSLPLP